MSKNDSTFNDSDRTARAGRSVMRRIVRILHACGLSRSDLLEMARTEIGDLIEPTEGLLRTTTRQTLVCSNIVLRWRRDPRFVGADGLPLQLIIAGGSLSFSEIVQAVAPGESVDEILRTMKQLGAVRETCPNTIELITESMVTCSGREGVGVASEPVLRHIGGFLGSVEHNLLRKSERQSGRFERACYAVVPPGVAPILERLIASKGQDFVDSIDEWLSRRSFALSRQEEAYMVGAGAYVFIERETGAFSE